jgi:4-amino-4-deoxy-L-arabinose transferase-like glycosyltransferase
MTNSTTTINQVGARHHTTERASHGVQASARRVILLDAATITLACAIFLGICLYQIELPGLYNDEAFDVIPAMQLVKGQPVEVLPGASLDLFGLRLPLMSSSAYQGVTSTYLAIPFFAIGGVNVISLRLMTALVGVVAIIITFFLARSWFGPTEARLATLMLAVSPAWVFWSRLGVYVVSEVVPIAGGALLAFTGWARRRPFAERNGLLYLGMFLLGLGLTTKLLFLWYIVALGICTLILWGRELWESRRNWLRGMRSWLRISLLAGVSFCIGAFPFLLYNLKTRGTFYTIRDNLVTTTHGVNNTAFLRNLWGEADSFRVLLDGSYFWFQGVLGRTYANLLTPTLFALSAIGLVVLLLMSRRKDRLELDGRARFSIGALGLAAALAVTLPTTSASGGTATLLLVATILFGGIGALILTVSTFRSKMSVVTAGWILLVFTVAMGAVWWFGGAGRPEGPAPGVLLGLWPIDAAGILFWLGGVCMTVVLGADRNPARHQRATVATLAIIGLVVAQSTVTVSGLWSTHLLILLPLPQIVIAAFAVMLTRRWSTWVAKRVQNRGTSSLRVLPAVLIVAAIIYLDLGVDYSYHRDLTATGGGSTFSDAIYSLVEYLEERDQKVVAMDWGFRRPVQLLTEGRIDPVEAYGLEEPPIERFYVALRQMLSEPGNLYLFHPREPRSASAYPRHEQFFAEVKAAGKEAVLEMTFYHRDGVPVYEVYSVR